MQATLRLLERLRDPLLRESRGRCVAAYVRHGDKAVEMRLVPFAAYASAAKALFNDSDPGPRLLFLGTEDFRVVQEAASWGRREGVWVRPSNLSAAILADKLTSINPNTLGDDDDDDDDDDGSLSLEWL